MRAPYSNPNLEDEFDWRREEHHEISLEMAGLFMQDYANREKGKIAPDTTGADYFFIDEFITENMEYDFSLIEQEFLKNCSGRLLEFNEAGWYGEDEHLETGPKRAMHKKIMRLIYNGAKLADEYCLELIKYLYKLYHRKEYNQLKRFHVISAEEIWSLADCEEWGGISFGTVGRILGMCQFMNIEQNESCSVLYLYLDKRRKEWIADHKEEQEFIEVEEGLFKECMRQVEQWDEADEKNSKGHPMRMNKVFREEDEFVGACLRQSCYREDYAYLCMENPRSIWMQMARTLALLKTLHPKKEYSYEEVQRYTVLHNTTEALADLADCFDFELGYLTGDFIDDFEKEDMQFCPEHVVVNRKSSNPKPQTASKPMLNVAPVSMGEASKEDYLKEIASLRRKINEKEQENKNLREMYRQSKKAQDDSEKLVNQYQSEREELIALREFVYKSELQAEPIPEENIEKMAAVIAQKKVVIIGGHINWINKLKKQFPEWLFVLPDAYKTVDGKMLEGKDKVYFFTDYLNHVTYGKYIAAVRERKIPFGYLTSRNMEQIVRQIYDEVNS